MLSMFERPSWNIVKHLLEGTTHLSRGLLRQQRAKQLIRTKWLRIINWNPGLRLGEEDDIKKQLAGQ